MYELNVQIFANKVLISESPTSQAHIWFLPDNWWFTLQSIACCNLHNVSSFCQRELLN